MATLYDVYGIYNVQISLQELPKAEDFKENFKLSEEQYLTFRAADRGSYGILPMLLCVIRTDKLSNFATDLFCPTFANCALKVNKMVGRIISGIGFLFLDIVTLPLRLLTLLPRLALAIARTKENHPLYIFLQCRSSKPEMYRAVDTIHCNVREPKKGERGKSFDGIYHFTPVPKPVDQFNTLHLV